MILQVLDLFWREGISHGGFRSNDGLGSPRRRTRSITLSGSVKLLGQVGYEREK